MMSEKLVRQVEQRVSHDLVDNAAPSFKAEADFTAVQQGDGFLTSASQERFWFLNEIAVNKAIYHLPMALQLEGDLDVQLIERCLLNLVKRHDSLRTVFGWENEALVQKVISIDSVKIDLSNPVVILYKELTVKLKN